jgi:hypothetical protein
MARSRLKGGSTLLCVWLGRGWPAGLLSKGVQVACPFASLNLYSRSVVLSLEAALIGGELVRKTWLS